MSELKLKPQDRQSLDFAENEREKSKNLFNINSSFLYGYYTWYQEYQVNGNQLISKNNYYSLKCKGFKIPTKPNTDYMLSYDVVQNENNSHIYIYGYDGSDYVDIVGYTDNGNIFQTHQFNSGNYEYCVIGFSSADGGTNIYENIQVEEGTVATKYQPYNGATVRDKQLKEAAEKRTLRYEHEGEDVINIHTSTLTTLKEYWDLFNLDKQKIYKCYFDPETPSNFKTLMGNPTTSSYIFYFVRFYQNGTSSGVYNSFEVICRTASGTELAVGYIQCGTKTDTVNFTGWTKIGG